MAFLSKLSDGYEKSTSNWNNFTGHKGLIHLHNYEYNSNQEWNVDSDCPKVQIISTHFKTEPCCDYVTIEDMRYSGDGIVINQIVNGSFSVIFTFNSTYSVPTTSDLGFVLQWLCHSAHPTGTTLIQY